MELKICMFLARFYPITGGAELQAQRLASMLIGMGHKAFILTARLKGLKKYELYGNLPVFRTFTFGTGFVSSLFFCVSSFIFLLRNAKKYDIIHLHLASSHAFPAMLIKILLGKKIILKFGGARKTGDIRTANAKSLGKLKLKMIAKNFNAFVVPSKEVYQEVISAKFPKEKIFIIPNGVNCEIFTPVDDSERINLRKKLNLPSENFFCIYTGRLEKGKGLEVLLEIWKSVSEQITLLIIGKGSLLNELKNSFLQKNIYFLGFQENIADYLKASNIFILPSFGEGLSNALLEAMSCGLIVIANKIAANEEIIENGINGFLVDIADTQKAIQLISKIYSEKKLFNKMKNLARQTAVEKFSLPYIANQYFQLYQKVLDKN